MAPSLSMHPAYQAERIMLELHALLMLMDCTAALAVENSALFSPDFALFSLVGWDIGSIGSFFGPSIWVSVGLLMRLCSEGMQPPFGSWFVFRVTEVSPDFVGDCSDDIGFFMALFWVVALFFLIPFRGLSYDSHEAPKTVARTLYPDFSSY